jgi:cardiolipin synthase
MIKDWKKEIFTIPNLLSLFRLILIPVYVIIYLNADSGEDYLLAAVILAISCLTDLADGKIARHFNMISNLGKVLDPIADKATQLALIICLAVHYPLLWVVIGLFLVKEGFQAIAALVILRKGRMLDGALFSGKICTTILFISLIVMVLIPNLPELVVTIMVIVDSIFMVIAFVDYIRVYVTNDSKIKDIDSMQ